MLIVGILECSLKNIQVWANLEHKTPHYIIVNSNRKSLNLDHLSFLIHWRGFCIFLFLLIPLHGKKWGLWWFSGLKCPKVFFTCRSKRKVEYSLIDHRMRSNQCNMTVYILTLGKLSLVLQSWVLVVQLQEIYLLLLQGQMGNLWSLSSDNREHSVFSLGLEER